MSKFSQGYCPTCEKKVLALKTPTNHILHFILSFLSLGLWTPIWILAALGGSLSPWRCHDCGSEVKGAL